MSNFNQSEPSQRSWITSRIAWLSVCIIAAAWGNRLLPSEWQNVWGGLGAFGLTAALGLASIAATRNNATARANQN